MRSFGERNLSVIGALGVLIVGVVVVGALQYKRLPFVNNSHTYSAYFSEASGLRTGAPVQIAGVDVGEVSSVGLVDSDRVLVRFQVDSALNLGDRTEASVKTKSLLGSKTLEITPRGTELLTEAIPLSRTTPAYQLPDALADLSVVINGLQTDQLNASLQTLADTFRDTPADLRVAVAGVSRFSQTLAQRDLQLRALLADARKFTGVLAERADEVVRLVRDTNALLAQVRTESAALDRLSNNITEFTQQISGVIADNREQLHPALDKLNSVLETLDNRKERIQMSINMLHKYAMSLGETVASGPFFKAYVANLLPGQFVQPYVDAAFSDLGLDPNVLLPSERTDPPVGQQGTPALPVPYPRTGQGGPPRLTLPDAITGKPGDLRYPYHDPPPPAPPGDPPPAAPALLPPDQDGAP